MAASTSAQILIARSRSILSRDRGLYVLPVLGAVLATLGFLVVAGPLEFATYGTHNHVVSVLVAVPGLFVATFFGVLFQVALAEAAASDLRGQGLITWRQALSRAWARRATIVGWSVVSTIVGTVIRALERRGLAGLLTGIVAGLAWAVATFMVVPVLAFESVGPIDAVRESSRLLKERFGTVVRSQLRFGISMLKYVLPAMIVLVVGISMLVGHADPARTVAGGVLAVLGLGGLFAASFYASAISTFLRTAVYLFAREGLSVDGTDMAGFFARK